MIIGNKKMSTKKLLSTLLGITCFAISSCGGIENNSFFPPIEEQITKSTNNSYSNPTYPLLFKTRETVLAATPANFATSFILAIGLIPFYSLLHTFIYINIFPTSVLPKLLLRSNHRQK